MALNQPRFLQTLRSEIKANYGDAKLALEKLATELNGKSHTDGTIAVARYYEQSPKNGEGGIVKTILGLYESTTKKMTIFNSDTDKVDSLEKGIESADKLDQELKVTGVNVGNLKNGVTLEKGQSIEDILREMLMKEIDAKDVPPTVSISHTGTEKGTHEVGTEVSVTLSHTYSDGKFIGATSDYNLSQKAECKEDTTTYYRDSVALESNKDTHVLGEETINYKCTTTYGADSVDVVTNLNKPSSVKIDAGTAESASISFTGKYKYFMGFKSGKEASEGILSSAEIRTLNTKTDWVNKGDNTVVGSNAIKSDGGSIILAIPEGCTLASVSNGLGADIKDNFSVTKTVNVSCAGIATKNYTLYVYPITNGATVEFKNMVFRK